LILNGVFLCAFCRQLAGISHTPRVAETNIRVLSARVAAKISRRAFRGLLFCCGRRGLRG
jgi:hypothetical protein